MSPAPTVVVAGGSPLVRSSLARVLAAELGAAVPGVAGPDELLELLGRVEVDVVVAPVRVGPRPLRELLPGLLAHAVRVLVVCGEGSTSQVPDLLFAGASGFLSLEDCTAADLVGAVRTVAEGGASLNPEVAAAVLLQWRDQRARPAPERAALTGRELEVLGQMATGAPARLVARALELSPKTVEAHTSRIYAKLGVRTRAQAVRVALDAGLVPAEPGSASPDTRPGGRS